MSENQTAVKSDDNTATVDAGKQDSQETKPDPKKYVERTYLDDITANRDELKSELRALKDQISSSERKNAEDKGDVEALRVSFQKEVNDAKAEAEQWKSRFHDKALKSEVLTEIAKVSNDPQLAYMVLEKEFELSEKDGEFIPRVKNSTSGIAEFVERRLNEMQKPHLLKSKRVPGTGDTAKTGNGEAVGEVSELPASFESFSHSEKVEFFRKNPKLGAKVARAAMSQR